MSLGEAWLSSGQQEGALLALRPRSPPGLGQWHLPAAGAGAAPAFREALLGQAGSSWRRWWSWFYGAWERGFPSLFVEGLITNRTVVHL